MTVPIRIAQSLFALVAFVATIAPLAAQAQDGAAPSRPETGGDQIGSLDFDFRNFAVLSAAPANKGAVTCTDSTIMGNVGSSGKRPAVVQTRCSITGRVVAPVTPAVLAQFDSAFDNVGNRTCQTLLAGTLAGRTLAPGVYCFAAAAAVTGTLTLDGPATGIWIIQVHGNLTGKSFSMVLANGARPCNVYLESSGATTMTGSNAKGNVYAGQAITLTGGTFVGHAFAKKAVTTTNVAASECSQ